MVTVDALLEQLRVLDSKPDVPVSIFHIGVPLTGAGHSHDHIMNALFYLESKKAVELLLGNRRRVI